MTTTTDEMDTAMSEFSSLEDINKAFIAMSAAIARTSKAVAEIGEVARRLNRDLIRASRRTALFHNGGRPRG